MSIGTALRSRIGFLTESPTWTVDRPSIGWWTHSLRPARWSDLDRPERFEIRDRGEDRGPQLSNARQAASRAWRESLLHDPRITSVDEPTSSRPECADRP
jgi:hypothetical protein